MNLSPSSLARRERAFVEQIRSRLQQQRWLRLHVSLIALLTLGGLLLAGLLLRMAGVESLALRYALALPLAYLIYLGLLRLWAGYLLGDEDAGPDALDALDVLPDLPLPRSGGSTLPRIEPGGGGDFGGGGASASFADGSADAGDGVGEIATEVAGKTLKLGAEALDSDEGAVVVVPLLVVLAIGALLMAMLGVGVFALFGVDVLMGVALEVALAGLAGGFAWRRRREGWLSSAFGHTWKAALALLLMGVLVGALLDHWVPQARSLPHALQLMRSR